MDEKDIIIIPPMKPPPLLICECTSDQPSLQQHVEVPPRKQRHLNIVYKTENYLRRRRIPELIRYLMTKVVSDGSSEPVLYLEQLLNDCMLYRAGHGPAPVLFEKCHIEAILKSFDPLKRGWLTAGQMRRAFMTIGLEPISLEDDKILYDDALLQLMEAQEKQIYSLLAAGSEFAPIEDCDQII